MSTTNKFWTIFPRITQALGFSSKTYSLFRPIPKGNYLRRKGHLLKNPTDDQIEAIYVGILRKARIDQWSIQVNTQLYDDYNHDLKDNILPWTKRPVSLINKIIISSIDSTSWTANGLYEFETSKGNDITPGTPLPGTSCHLFVNTSGISEKTSDYDNITFHTPLSNVTSLNIAMQYIVTNNNSAPPKKTITALERLLTAVCLELKLNPYKAIRGQRELWWARKFGFLGKGKHSLLNVSPGRLVPLEAIRTEVAIKMQKKLKYADVYDGEIDGEFNRATKKALNNFQSDSIKHLYNHPKLVRVSNG